MLRKRRKPSSGKNSWERNVTKTILTILLVSSMATAAEPTCDIPTQIKKGDASPCAGYVISKETEEAMRMKLATNDKIIENMTKIQQSQDNVIKINNEQMKIYEENMRSQQKFSSFEKFIYFGLGAGLTGLVAYGAVKAVR